MSVVIRRFMERFFPRQNEYSFSIFGVGGGGRTTLLYQLKLNEVITPIPTFGMNVEVVEAPTFNSLRPLKFSGWDFGLGCASQHTMARLYATYVGNGDALIWVVDASDRGVLQESVQMLNYMMSLVDPILEAAGRKDRFPILLYVSSFPP
jgi:ADP-ribosylation factor protein 6